jgi:hypothetical protein
MPCNKGEAAFHFVVVAPRRCAYPEHFSLFQFILLTWLLLMLLLSLPVLLLLLLLLLLLRRRWRRRLELPCLQGRELARQPVCQGWRHLADQADSDLERCHAPARHRHPAAAGAARAARAAGVGAVVRDGRGGQALHLLVLLAPPADQFVELEGAPWNFSVDAMLPGLLIVGMLFFGLGLFG